MIPERDSVRLLLATIAALAGVAVIAGAVGSVVGAAVAALVPVLLGEILLFSSRPPRDRLVVGMLVALAASALALGILTASEHEWAITLALALVLVNSVAATLAIAPRVPWANFGMAAAVAGLLGSAIAAVLAFRGPLAVLVVAILALGAAAFLTVPATVLGRLATGGALALTVPPAVVALHPISDTLDRPFFIVFVLLTVIAGHTALVLGVVRAAQPVPRERVDAPPLVSIWDHLRADT